MMLLLADIDIGALIPLVIIVIGVVYNLIRKAFGGEEEAERDRARQRQREQLVKQQQQAGTAQAKKEPMLPYEDLVDQMFGPYIEARKRKHAAAVAEEEEDEEPAIRILDESPAPPPKPALRIIEEMPPPVDLPGAIDAPGSRASRGGKRRRSLNEILFRNARLSEGAKLVLASEILSRPRPGRFPRVP